MNVFTGHKSSQVNSLSTLNTTTGTSLGSRPRGKINRKEEGVEGLPEEYKPASEKEEASSCFSCNKILKKKLGALTKSGRHHCRRCGKTVCDRCWKNYLRISKSDKQDYQVCDCCDFEITNYQTFITFD